MNFEKMTDTEKMCYLLNCMASIKEAINSEGGNITDSTPFDQYASKISAVTNIEAKTITATTSAQTIEATGGVDGFAPLTVNAVTAAIDENIIAGNIKLGTTILGVEGSVVELAGEEIEVTPSTSEQTIEPTEGKNGITQVSVSAVTASIDANIIAENIKSGVTILGVEGTYAGGE